MRKNLLKCFYFALFGNIAFILFAIVCFIYYYAFGSIGVVVKSIEAIAYAFEGTGFVLNLVSAVYFFRTVRARMSMKVGYCVYIISELVMMILELNSYQISFYKPYSLPLAIIHSLFSAVICFSFLLLEPKRTCLEVMVTIAVGIMFFGMMGNIFGIRIYFSILTNAVAYVVLFASVIFFIKQERIEIDCYGDKARVAKYKSTFFEE